MPSGINIEPTEGVAIAAAGAVIKYVEFGLFFLQFEIIYTRHLRGGLFELADECLIKGRTNTGVSMKTTCTVVFSKESNDLPIQKVIVELVTAERTPDEVRRYFECSVVDNEFMTKELEEYPRSPS